MIVVDTSVFLDELYEGNLKTLAANPCFNERIPVAYVVTLAREHVDTNFRKKFDQKPPFIVDDGSSDGTAAVAKAAGAQVISHLKNKGKSAAMCKEYFLRSRGY
ncbi:MAG: glycosyltransferase [Candidatus Methanospirareceae archaeon]